MANLNPPEDQPLTPRESLFVIEYLSNGLNASRAYEAAGFTSTTPGSLRAKASQLLSRPNVAARVKEKLDERAAACNISARDVLTMWAQIATADPNELVRMHRFACRHCHGRDHAYQWVDDLEYAFACAAATKTHDREFKRWEKDGAEGPPPVLDMPSYAGGIGYDKRLEPVGSCPKCNGEGDFEAVPQDTRKLSPAARRLYAGVKKTKDGWEVKMRDQDAAALNLARHLGMLNDKLNVSVTGTVTVDDAEAVKKLTTEELSTLLALREKMDASSSS